MLIAYTRARKAKIEEKKSFQSFLINFKHLKSPRKSLDDVNDEEAENHVSTNVDRQNRRKNIDYSIGDRFVIFDFLFQLKLQR